MRSVFPALQDRLLSSILVGAVLLLLATLVAVAVSGKGSEAQAHSESPTSPPTWMGGGTHAAN